MKVLVLFRTRESDKKVIEEILGDISELYYSKEEVDLSEVDVILTGSGSEVTDELISKCKNLKLIQLLAAGVDLIPFDRLPDNVLVAGNAGGNSIPVAEHAIGLLFAALKHIAWHTERMREGMWNRYRFGRLLFNKTVGIIGFGHIGCEIARMLKPFNVKLMGVNRSGVSKCPEVEMSFLGRQEELDKVLSESDIVFLILPLTRETRGLIDKEKLNKMKKDAILVNVGRGAVIVEEDLYHHLKENKEFIAALDVWWHYPNTPIAEEFYQKYPFHELENVVMTPHIAGFTEELRSEVIAHAARNIRRFIETGKVKNVADKKLYI